MNFEKTLNELEVLIEKMETGQLSLEDSLKSFEEGIKLARHCQKSLKEAEQKVEILVDSSAKGQKTEKFELETEN